MWLEDLASWLEIPMKNLTPYYGPGIHMGVMYRHRTIPKKGGGFRRLAEPEPSLKSVQRRIYAKLLLPAWHHKSCYGFRPGLSISDNAACHVGQEMVVKVDLKDFFPSVTARRVYGVFFPIVGSDPIALFLTKLTTDRGVLPQGAPTSPALANLACRRLDARMEGLAASLKGGRYSRYADDLTLSGVMGIERSLPLICQIIQEEGWVIAKEKTRIMPYWQRQKVTGLVVNSEVGVPREYRRNLKAAMHTRDCKRPIHWQGRRIKAQRLDSHVTFVQSVHPGWSCQRIRQETMVNSGK